ncbi:hypothetical protein SDC9_69465 [bioreactor metagenome]|uniref:Uncharacterized protein n=1 Tax=bioreactor metagenome TaxID=1076179 RepID=A0A644Y8V2_9ZZZZ
MRGTEEVRRQAGVGGGGLLADDQRIGIGPRQDLGQPHLGLAVGDGDQVTRPLLRDLVAPQSSEPGSDHLIGDLLDDVEDLVGGELTGCRHVPHCVTRHVRPGQGPAARPGSTLPVEVVLGDEVDQPLDLAQQPGVEIVPVAHPGQDELPGRGDVRLVGVRPAHRRADPVLPVGAAWDPGPFLQSQPGRFHRLPDVDVAMAGDQHVVAPGAGRDLLDDA